MALHLKDLRLANSFTLANWQMLNTEDLDLGSADRIVFPLPKWTYSRPAQRRRRYACSTPTHSAERITKPAPPVAPGQRHCVNNQ